GIVSPSFFTACQKSTKPNNINTPATKVKIKRNETQLLLPTFLGNDQRRFYGTGKPEGLAELDKILLGEGDTRLGTNIVTWYGAGWTGQPTIIRDQGKLYILMGSFDHSLRKISLDPFKEVWRYEFDDILKGTCTVYIDETASTENKIVILQGSRLGIKNYVYNPNICPSFRAISFRTGKELWRFNVKQTPSFSRDNDSSPILVSDSVFFNACENGYGYFIHASASKTEKRDNLNQPTVLSELKLYDDVDVVKHHRNLVSEASPARWGEHLYLASGSGHIYGIHIPERKIVWDYPVGSDMDGTTAISIDGMLFCAIEKEFIPGSGGVLKLDPSKKAEEAEVWFLPTGDKKVSKWQGGVIGSVAINDEYREENEPALFATHAIDGFLYIGSQHQVTGEKVWCPRNKKKVDTPVIVAKIEVGSSISTPIFTDGNRLVSCGYKGVYLFEIIYEPVKPGTPNAVQNAKGDYFVVKVNQIARALKDVSIEATPIVWDGIVYVGCRDGYLHALG
ncbi:MAG: hypothetical protein NZ108_09010, partial [Bacteroidia bacterium]|nr:hypothetical protein [Bacteroidia bacterium]